MRLPLQLFCFPLQPLFRFLYRFSVFCQVAVHKGVLYFGISAYHRLFHLFKSAGDLFCNLFIYLHKLRLCHSTSSFLGFLFIITTSSPNTNKNTPPPVRRFISRMSALPILSPEALYQGNQAQQNHDSRHSYGNSYGHLSPNHTEAHPHTQGQGSSNAGCCSEHHFS